jgi:hypothetical protein
MPFPSGKTGSGRAAVRLHENIFAESDGLRINRFRPKCQVSSAGFAGFAG